MVSRTKKLTIMLSNPGFVLGWAAFNIREWLHKRKGIVTIGGCAFGSLWIITNLHSYLNRSHYFEVEVAMRYSFPLLNLVVCLLLGLFLIWIIMQIIVKKGDDGG